jgi:hypothetical protein
VAEARTAFTPGLQERAQWRAGEVAVALQEAVEAQELLLMLS